MAFPKGVKRDFEALEKRRIEAVRLVVEEGLSQGEAARRVKAAQQSVSGWVRRYRQQGPGGLAKAGRAGRKPLLNDEQLAQLEALLLAGPEAQGFPTPLWTCPRVARLIRDRFGVRYHEGHVWKLLQALNWSPQRPVGKARERNEQAIQTGKSKTWPAIKKSLRTGAYDRLHRRIRTQLEAASLSHLGAARTDAGVGVQLQLAEALRGGRHHVAQLLLSAV